MSFAVGAVLAERALAESVADTLKQIEAELEYHNRKKAKNYQFEDQHAHWRMFADSRERLVELRLRMERISIG